MATQQASTRVTLSALAAAASVALSSSSRVTPPDTSAQVSELPETSQAAPAGPIAQAVIGGRQAVPESKPSSTTGPVMGDAGVLPLPEAYRTAFDLLPPPLRERVVHAVRAEFSDPLPTAPADVVRLLTDAMAQSGYTPGEIVPATQSFLSFGVFTVERTLAAQAELRRLFPEVVPESLDQGPEASLSSFGLNLSWFNSANDPVPNGYSKLEAEREERRDQHWLPAPGTLLVPELWVSVFSFSRLNAGVAPGDQLCVFGAIDVFRQGADRQERVYAGALDLLFDEAEHAGFTTRRVELTDLMETLQNQPREVGELRLQLRYAVRPEREGGDDSTPANQRTVLKGEVHLRMKPAYVSVASLPGQEPQLVGYTFEPLGPAGETLAVPGVAEPFFRTALLNLLDLRKEPLRRRALVDQRAAEVRSQMFDQPLPEIGLLAHVPQESGFASLPVFPRAGQGEREFSGTITSAEGLQEYLKGKVTLLDFWTTWCRPCLESIPYNNSLHEAGNVQVLGLLDGAEARNLRDLSRTIESHNVRYPVAVIDERTFSRFGGPGYPYYVLVDWRQGDVPRVVWSHVGTNHEKTNEAIRQLLLRAPER